MGKTKNFGSSSNIVMREGFMGGYGHSIYGEATIYVNGKNLGYHDGWLQPVHIDITKVSNLKGKNT